MLEVGAGTWSPEFFVCLLAFCFIFAYLYLTWQGTGSVQSSVIHKTEHQSFNH